LSNLLALVGTDPSSLQKIMNGRHSSIAMSLSLLLCISSLQIPLLFVPPGQHLVCLLKNREQLVLLAFQLISDVLSSWIEVTHIIQAGGSKLF
jgi:hypothetical protein